MTIIYFVFQLGTSQSGFYHQENIKLLFYIAKLRFARLNLFLLQNIDCGYSLEPPRRGPFSHNIRFEQKYQKYLVENFQFLKLKNLCLLHGHVFVMSSQV